MQTRPRAIALALAVLVFVGGLAGCSTASDAVTDVSASEAVKVLAEPDLTVIDVRTPAEFDSGHLDGAINIDIEGNSFDQQVADLPKDGAYFVYCRSGNRSGTATDHLVKLGFTHIYDLQGGITDWQASGGAVVKS
ncbi:rhodanese-like domain-containing protein [Pengzhenrongella phosphoraccumulans]|uniref:rhodanese-like domain-containing protein n=1 Tax=Pengzhenrongella phosphoraccumulans TaxID=3114394 RepID=UPI00388EADC7